MTLPELMDALAARDVRLSLRLAADAPCGAMTDELQCELAAHKPAIIQRLVVPVQEPAHEPAEPSPGPETGNQAIMPPAGSWHRSIAWWPIEWRKRWADRAEAKQAEGLPGDRAEWGAFCATVADINAAEARGEWIDFQPPVETLYPFPFPAFDSLPGPADEARAREEGGAWNAAVKARPGNSEKHEAYRPTRSHGGSEKRLF
jgi:hypothetical protein